MTLTPISTTHWRFITTDGYWTPGNQHGKSYGEYVNCFIHCITYKPGQETSIRGYFSPFLFRKSGWA